jgi:hypothetical protein
MENAALSMRLTVASLAGVVAVAAASAQGALLAQSMAVAATLGALALLGMAASGSRKAVPVRAEAEPSPRRRS